MLEPITRRWPDQAVSPGVRFRVFIQPPVVPGFEVPETIILPASAGEIDLGPSDRRFYTVMPAVTKRRYAPPDTLPPYQGRVLPPAVPDRFGHFDTLPEESSEFRAAHVFAIARMTLAVWEQYRGQEIPWAFHFPRMELVPEIDWTNAHSGYGFIELGHNSERGDGARVPYWQNFDVVAHEVGHAILFSLMGLPVGTRPNREYRAFHETGSDLIAIVTAMHSERLLWHVLDSTSGNIYGFNELNRLGEVSAIDQVRLVCNDLRVPEVINAEKLHTYSLPVTGALFDIFALRYLRALQRRQAVSAVILDELLDRDSVEDVFERLHGAFVAIYPANRRLFYEALEEARDYLGTLLVRTFDRLPTADMSYLAVANTVLATNEELTGGDDEEELAEIFLWRGIGSRYQNGWDHELTTLDPARERRVKNVNIR